ncbi:MAG: phosphotransferase [Oryzihumus sp.]
MTGRAVGVRLPWTEVPARVRDWAEATLGSPVVSAADQVGGMSPGCATRLECADGSRAFVKAVGPELNPVTPSLFRREAYALDLLGRHPSWAELHAVLDEPDGWVALLLEDVPGARPDVHDGPGRDRLCAATDELTATLHERVPVPPSARTGADLADVRRSLTTWADGLAQAPTVSSTLMPRWVVDRLDDLRADCDRLVERADPDRLVHWDIRDDNLLTRPDGTIVFVDWGGASRGPEWTDPLIARLEGVEDPWFDASVHRSPALARLGDDLVTAFLVGIGAFLAWRVETAVDVNLPTLNDFRRTESARFLAGAARRLGVDREDSLSI